MEQTNFDLFNFQPFLAPDPEYTKQRVEMPEAPDSMIEMAAEQELDPVLKRQVNLLNLHNLESEAELL